MRRVLTLVCSLLACRAPIRAPSAPHPEVPPPTTACAASAAEIQEARALAAAGKLLRARRALTFRTATPANESLCLTTLLEIADTLGDSKTLHAVSQRATAIALPREVTARIANAEQRWLISGAVPAAMKAKSAAAFADGIAAERAGKLADALSSFRESARVRHPHPAGQALVRAGELARALGKAEESQSLFDRAVIALERETGAPARLATHRVLPCVQGGPAVFRVDSFRWLPHGEYLAVGCDTFVEIEDIEKLRPLARYDEVSTPLAMDPSEAPALHFKSTAPRTPEPDSDPDPDVHESATAVSHDGKLVVTAGWKEQDIGPGKTKIEPTIGLRSVDGQPLWRVAGPRYPVGLLRFSADDTEVTGYLVPKVPFDWMGTGLFPWSYEGRGMAHTWSVKTGALLRTTKDAPRLSDDGKWTWSVRDSAPRNVELRQVGSAFVRSFATGEDFVRQVSLSPSGRFLAVLAHRESGGPPEDEQPRIWNVATGAEVTPPHLRAWRDDRDELQPQELSQMPYAQRGGVIWKLTEPAAALRVYAPRTMPSGKARRISAVKWLNEDVDFERDEVDPFSCTGDDAAVRACRIFDPRGPIAITDAARASAELHCRIGVYRFPLAVCLDAFPSPPK
jgi:hypothetical protein